MNRARSGIRDQSCLTHLIRSPLKANPPVVAHDSKATVRGESGTPKSSQHDQPKQGHCGLTHPAKCLYAIANTNWIIGRTQMTLRIFYAWQSDRNPKLNRNLIKDALKRAAKKVKSDPDICDANREIEIDHDTKGVTGSPLISETIFEKIRKCDIFIADLTLISAKRSPKPTPNPNVLVEYGYALHALESNRVIGVINESFGQVAKLPFDIRSRRCMRYSTNSLSSIEELREQLTNNLAAHLKELLKEISGKNVSFDKKLDNKPAAPSLGHDKVVSPILGSGSQSPKHVADAVVSSGYPHSIPHSWWDGTIGGRENTPLTDPHHWLKMEYGPHISLKLQFRHGFRKLTNFETTEQVRRHLLPLGGARAQGSAMARNADGPVVFLASHTRPDVAISATQFYSWGELLAVDFYCLRRKKKKAGETPVIPTTAVEEILTDGLLNAMKFAREGLEARPPFAAQVGFVDVEGYRLAVNPEFFHGEKTVGYIHRNQIGDSFEIESTDADPFDLLRPTFEEVYDAADEVRPDIRATGRLRQ